MTILRGEQEIDNELSKREDIILILNGHVTSLGWLGLHFLGQNFTFLQS